MIVRLTEKQHRAMQFGPGALAARGDLQRNFEEATRTGRDADARLFERDLRTINKFIVKLGLDSEANRTLSR
ncbi:hypothetical protein K9U39_05815 [Rhodoblastus acidophilus]|uniref:Uncharacterized protein n=1 Tax=Candidatus Rhodoblastus alkanivorans TaxID=2954117 RepID=A0ABS9Z659_9HYPH|nr:hypothetical protein [Candidatus Rhodoblastus alkanivorans]MCI4679162.1 hypothetical protein [Candidatus Rhodoblastus alkanivorans]MCI4683158.1 hypothetical protein [Candidatus Rhodoblastus alkanivorans]MDI4640469.1 hypothetical protein [Rhodoblastus acidophilus]